VRQASSLKGDVITQSVNHMEILVKDFGNGTGLMEQWIDCLVTDWDNEAMWREVMLKVKILKVIVNGKNRNYSLKVSTKVIRTSCQTF
jgi:hypothetical protein